MICEWVTLDKTTWVSVFQPYFWIQNTIFSYKYAFTVYKVSNNYITTTCLLVYSPIRDVITRNNIILIKTGKFYPHLLIGYYHSNFANRMNVTKFRHYLALRNYDFIVSEEKKFKNQFFIFVFHFTAEDAEKEVCNYTKKRIPITNKKFVPEDNLDDLTFTSDVSCMVYYE